MTLDDTARKISVISDKLNDTLLERKRNKLTDLREGKERTETRGSTGVRDRDVEEDDVSGTNRAEGGPSVQQIENFICDVRQQVSRRDFERHKNNEVEVSKQTGRWKRPWWQGETDSNTH